MSAPECVGIFRFVPIGFIFVSTGHTMVEGTTVVVSCVLEACAFSA